MQPGYAWLGEDQVVPLTPPNGEITAIENDRLASILTNPPDEIRPGGWLRRLIATLAPNN